MCVCVYVQYFISFVPILGFGYATMGAEILTSFIFCMHTGMHTHTRACTHERPHMHTYTVHIYTHAHKHTPVGTDSCEHCLLPRPSAVSISLLALKKRM